METDRYVSPLSERYASKEMQYIFSPDMKFRTWRKLWIALAETEMELGLSQNGKPVISQEQIDELASPEWILQSRSTDTTLASFEQDADRVDAIATVFPAFFFLVAALVSLGYTPSDAAAAVARVDETLPVQDIIKVALRSLSRAR